MSIATDRIIQAAPLPSDGRSSHQKQLNAFTMVPRPLAGADSGVGAESARVLSGRGAEVIMAVRNLPKGETGREDIRKYYPNAKLTIIECDLASLGSIKTFCKAFLATGKPLHVLMCNAGAACKHEVYDCAWWSSAPTSAV